ncbi:MAG: EVE domain-containing protein [Acidobacteriota bacterium]
MNWLVKEEPSTYSFAALQRDTQTSWSGVRNPLAQKHLKSMKKGDRVLDPGFLARITRSSHTCHNIPV